MEVTRHVQNTESRKLVIFLNYLKKKIFLISSVENKKLCIQNVTGDKFFQSQQFSILLGGMGVKKYSKLYHKGFYSKYDKQIFTCVIKYSSVATGLCSIGMQYIRILYGAPVMLLLALNKINTRVKSTGNVIHIHNYQREFQWSTKSFC